MAAARTDTREAPRGGEGDNSLLRVARAGADSPLRDAPRHYRVRRHFLRGPFLGRRVVRHPDLKAYLGRAQVSWYAELARDERNLDRDAARRIRFQGPAG